jgi:hypothetical protein
LSPPVTISRFVINSGDAAPFREDLSRRRLAQKRAAWRRFLRDRKLRRKTDKKNKPPGIPE